MMAPHIRPCKFSLTRSLVQKPVMPVFEQGSLSRKNSGQFMSYTRANKTTCQGKLGRLCGALSQGKLGRLCGALSQGKLVQLRTHEQLKLVKENCWGKNLFIVHTSKESCQGNCQGKLGRLCGA